MKKSLAVLITLLASYCSIAQDQHLIDSLNLKLSAHYAGKTTSSQPLYDSTAADLLNNLSVAYSTSDPQKSLEYANQSLALSTQIGYKKGMANAYNSLGNISTQQGDYLIALEWHKKALKIREEINDRIGIAASYNNIGNANNNLGNYAEALKNFLISLKMNEEFGDKKKLAGLYNNIGNVYRTQGNYEEALKNYFAALKLNQECGNKSWEAYNLGNIGVVYFSQGKYEKALEHYLASGKISEALGDKDGLAASYINLGEVYSKLGDPSKALKYLLNSLDLFKEVGNKGGMAYTYMDLGVFYTGQKKYKEADEYLNKALSLSKDIGNMDNIKLSYAGLATLDSTRGNFSGALENYKLYITYRDSLVNQENTKKITQQQMQYDFDKKESLTKAEQEKKDTVQRLTRNILVGGFMVMLLFAIVFLGQRNKISKEKNKSDQLLLNILPAEVADELKQNGHSKAQTFSDVSVMFTDFKDFTKISEKVSAEILVEELHTCFSAFDSILEKHKVEKIKTIGDAYLCASGLPIANPMHATDLVNAAIEIMDYIISRKIEKEALNEFSFELRIGINTGPVVAGIVGTKKFSYDIWGDTVNTAARMEQQSEAGKINISDTTYELVKDQFDVTHRGKIQAKNKGEVDMYFITRTRAAEL
jgi:adenylate cyclase